jgi:hypothetical protein
MIYDVAYLKSQLANMNQMEYQKRITFQNDIFVSISRSKVMWLM